MTDIIHLGELTLDELEENALEIIEGSGEHSIPLMIDIIHDIIGLPGDNRARDHILIALAMLKIEGFSGESEELPNQLKDHIIGATLFLEDSTPYSVVAYVDGTSAEMVIRPERHSAESVQTAVVKLNAVLSRLYKKVEIRPVPR